MSSGGREHQRVRCIGLEGSSGKGQDREQEAGVGGWGKGELGTQIWDGGQERMELASLMVMKRSVIKILFWKDLSFCEP